MAKSRESWGGNFGFLMAAIGSAVGLGNIWGFPYKMGANGGFAFLLVYLVLAFVVGYVVMVGELALGRKANRGCVGAYQKLSKKLPWIGWLGVLSAFFITCFYSVLGAYCIKYTVVNIGDIFGAGFGSAGRDGGKIFGAILTSPVESIVYTIIFMAMTYAVIASGVKEGIEKFNKWAMPALFFLLCVVIVRSLTLPGAIKGVLFMFEPNFKPFADNFLGVLSAASGQLFFSLSLGMAIMVTYGSYMTKDQDICKNSALIITGDTTVAILAGLAVIPAAIALGGEGAALAGPKLLYVTLQNVFLSMGTIGPWVGVAFYVLVVIAAVTSAVSLTETCVTFLMDKAHDRNEEGNRKKFSLYTCISITVLATVVAIDGLGSNGIWTPFQSTFGVHPWNDCWLDFLDSFTEGFFMPLGAFLMSLIIGYELKTDFIKEEITREGNRFMAEGFFIVCCKFVTPIVLLFVLYNQLKGFGIL